MRWLWGLVVGGVIVWRRWWGNVVVWWRWIGVDVLLSLIRQWILLLLLTEDVNGVLQFCQPHTLSVDMLYVSLDMLVATCFLMMDSCSNQSLSIPYWTLISSFSSASASSSFASSQSCTSILLSSASPWMGCGGGGGGGGLALRCCSLPLLWLVPTTVVDMLTCCS
jgi:hypothetical protein